MSRMSFGKCEIEKRILRRVPVRPGYEPRLKEMFLNLPFHRIDAARCKFQYIQTAISYESIIRGCCNGNTIIKKRRILHSVPVETLGTEFQK